jgi:Transposase IS66 family
MRLHLILPRVEPDQILPPTVCAYAGCPGQHFRLHQPVLKPVRDTVYAQVPTQRYHCLRCRRTFRVYPAGVTADHTSQRVKGLAVMLYLLGLSYGAVALALEALGVYMCKSRVYDAVQAAAQKVPGLKRRQVFGGVRTPAIAADVTSVKCAGRWLPLGLSVDPLSGIVLSLDRLPNEEAQTLQTWLAPVVAAVGAQLLVSDDADGFKTVADQLGLAQQICKSHVRRNTDALVENLTPLARRDVDGSLARLGVTAAQAVADVLRLGELVRTRQPAQAAELAALHARYAAARPGRPGHAVSLAYRLRLLFLDRWNLWRRLTRYRTWRAPYGETLDGTNNACERAIGWWVKERYRTMRGYKRVRSAVNVSRLLAWAGNHLHHGGADLARLLA